MSSFDISFKQAYYHRNFGELTTDQLATQADLDDVEARVEEYENTIQVSEEAVNVGYNTDNIQVSLGNGESGTTTDIRTEHFNAGRYLYLHSRNDYSGDTDSGLVLNVQGSASTYTVDSTGFSASTVHVSTASGLSSGAVIAVQSELNTGLYIVASHSSNVITIDTTPAEPWAKSSFNVESANGSIAQAFVSLIRGVTDGESEVAAGNTAPLSYNKIVYDSKQFAEVGQVRLTDDSAQIVCGSVEISVDGPTFPDVLPRNLTVPVTPIETPDDEFVLAELAQELTNKTILDTTNSVRATHLAYTGGGSLNIGGYTAPTSGQMLTNGSWKTPFTVTAGSGLNGGSGGGSGNTNITLTLNRDLNDETPDLDPPSPPAPGGGAGTGAAFAAAGGIVIGIAFAIAGAIAAAGGLFTYLDVEDNADIGGDLHVAGDTVIDGDLTVLGTTTSVSTTNNNVSDRYIQLNANYVTNSDQTTGIFSNKSGIGGAGTESEISNFTLDTDSYFTVVSGTFVEGDIVQIYSTELTPTSDNLGVVEVFEQVGSDVYIKGGVESATLGYVKKVFVNETPADDAIYAKKINVSLAEFQTDGSFNITTGSNALSLTSHDVAQQGTSVSFTNLALTSIANDDTAFKFLLLDPSNNVKYQNRNNGFSFGNMTATSAGGASNNLFYHYQQEVFSQTQYTYLLRTLDHIMVSDDSKITVASGAIAPPNFCLSVPIQLYVNGVFEDCLVTWIASSATFYIHRKDNSNFPAGATVRLGLDDRITGTTSKAMCQITYRNIA